MLLTDYKGLDFFSGNALHLNLESLGGSQTEGLVFTDKNELYISSEETKLPQAFYKVDWVKLLNSNK